MKTSVIDKSALLEACLSILIKRIEEFQATERSAQESAAGDTKSSMGDKHETSRELLQQEREMNGRRMAEALRQKEELERILPDSQFTQIQTGAFAETSLGWFFFSTALGFVSVGTEKVAVVSMASPIGQALKGKASGESVSFQGKALLIKHIC
ncbi:MAG: hypothetical protein RL092_906 [Bacteroidota bacterium]|jgi:hypothetical protein